MAWNYRLLWLNCGLLWGIVVNYFGMLGFPGTHDVYLPGKSSSLHYTPK